MHKEPISLAILGATGLVGEMLLTVLEELKLPIAQLYPLATADSAGDTVMFQGQPLKVLDAENFDFSQVQVAIFSAGEAASKQYVPRATEAGCVVVDNTSAFRYEDDVPLIVPEINGDKIELFRNRLLVANPNCSTIQLALALKPIIDEVGVTRVNVATYQSVSGAGQAGMAELAKQSAMVLNGQGAEAEHFDHPIAFNVIPQIDSFEANGYTREEMKMVWEIDKLYEDEQIGVNPTAVRVPVFYGHSEAVHIECEEKITAEQAIALWEKCPEITIDKDNQAYPMPSTHLEESNQVHIGRIREDISHPRGLNFWVVSDNIRRGAAYNAAKIVESLLVFLG